MKPEQKETGSYIQLSQVKQEEHLLHGLKAGDQLQSTVELNVDQLSGNENDEIQCIKSIVNQQIFDQDKQISKSFYAVITVMKTIVGSGILGLAAIMKNFGLLVGILIFILVFYSNQFTSDLLLRSKNLSRHSNFSTIGPLVLGKYSKIFINLTIILNNVGICMAELVIFGVTSTNIINLVFDSPKQWYTEFWFLTLVISVLISPLTFVKSIDKLKQASLFAIISIAVFCISNVFNFFIELHKRGDVPVGFTILPYEFSFTSSMACVSTIFLAFSYQFNYFPIMKSVKGCRDKQMSKISFLGTLASLVIYLTIGIFGYGTYGSLTKINLLQNYSGDTNAIVYYFNNIAFVISTALSFPVMFFGARNNFISLSNEVQRLYRQAKEKQLKNKLEANERMKPDANNPENIDITDNNKNMLAEQLNRAEDQPVSQNKFESQIRAKLEIEKQSKKVQFYIFTFLLQVSIVTVAILVQDIGPIFNVVGSISATAISYFFPCLFYVNLTKKKKNALTYISFMIIFAAAVVAVIGLVCEHI